MTPKILPYDPTAVSSPHGACERCHSKKIHCNIRGSDGPCSNCLKHDDECVLRARKRKKTSAKQYLGDADRVSKKSINPASAESESPLAIPNVFGRSAASASNDPLGPPIPAAQNTLDGFHNTSFLSRSVILVDQFPDLDHSHGQQGGLSHSLTSKEHEIMQLYQVFDLPELPVQQSLIDACYDRCGTWMPVVDFNSATSVRRIQSPSILVIQAVLMVGSQMRRGTSMATNTRSCYDKVKAILDTGYERNPVNVLAALCLIQWWNPAAPNDISTNQPRFWNTYAIGLAQQVGLHKEPSRLQQDASLRRRIWWTLYARDSLIASAHGRPRIINLADCTVERPKTTDFIAYGEVRAQIFISYVSICGILGDLCQLLTRSSSPSAEGLDSLGLALLEYMRTLPPGLLPNTSDGTPKAYSLELSQLHMPYLIAVTILFRPRSIFSLTQANTPALTASSLAYRLFEAMELRDDTYYLGSVFAWYLLVTAIPQLACTRIPSLCGQANTALDSVEGVLQTLGTKRPSAINNLRNVRKLRQALKGRDRQQTRPATPTPSPSEQLSFLPVDLFAMFGPQVTDDYRLVESLLTPQANEQTPGTNTFVADAAAEGIADASDDPFHGLPPLVGNEWMQNWFEELDLFGADHPS